MTVRTEKSIVVPWDYTERAEYALAHAIEYSRKTGKEIILVHIIKKEDDKEKESEKLQETAIIKSTRYGIKIETVVKAGNLFEEIKNVCRENKAEIAIMGTHGIKGLQKLTGSKALKVIAGSNTPFITVQEPPNNKEIKRIVFPVDFKLEEREKLIWADYMSRIFKCKFYICYLESDDPIVKRKTAGNIKAAISYLESKRINYEIQKLSDRENQAGEIINYAEKTESGMIILMTGRNYKLQDYVLGASEQQIIANRAKISVMCINPRKCADK